MIPINPEAIGDPEQTPVVYLGEGLGDLLGIPERSAVTVPSYTEEDVELLREAFREQYPSGGCDCGDCQNGLARAILAALSSAGRLVPPDGPPRDCGCPRVYRVGLDPTHRDGCPVIEKQRAEYAELLAEYVPWSPSVPDTKEGS